LTRRDDHDNCSDEHIGLQFGTNVVY